MGASGTAPPRQGSPPEVEAGSAVCSVDWAEVGAALGASVGVSVGEA